jgi:hypothetical protein
MSILTRMYPATASFASKLMLMVLMAGVLSPRPGGDRQVLPRVEVLFRSSELHPTSRVTTIAPWFADIANLAAGHSNTDWLHRRIHPKQTIGQINTRSLSSSYLVTACCNIPHQNTDEDDTFVYLPAVA